MDNPGKTTSERKKPLEDPDFLMLTYLVRTYAAAPSIMARTATILVFRALDLHFTYEFLPILVYSVSFSPDRSTVVVAAANSLIRSSSFSIQTCFMTPRSKCLRCLHRFLLRLSVCPSFLPQFIAPIFPGAVSQSASLSASMTAASDTRMSYVCPGECSRNKTKYLPKLKN